MAISFTAQQIKDITRRQLNIVQENAAYASTATALNAQQTALLNVDTANAAFYLAATQQAFVYEQEGRDLNGTIPATYTDGTISPYVAGDLSTSAAFPGSAGALFYPGGTYANLIPDPVNAVNGFLHPTGTDAQYELNIISNAIINLGLSQSISLILNGITGSGATATTSASLPGGVLTSHSLSISTSTGTFNANDYVTISDGTNSGIYQINSATMSALTISSVFPSTGAIATSANVDDTIVAFTETERETLVAASPSFQEILTNVTTQIAALVTAWMGKVSDQITQLTANTDSRSPVAAQNASALSADTAALTPINTWIALSNTGVNGKYASVSLSPLTALIATRISYGASRIPQILQGLGSVIVSGNTYTDGGSVLLGPYYERYKWLNNRINIASGSARRYFAANQGAAMLGTLQANNNAIQGDYSAYFVTKRITQIDTTPIVQVSDVTSLNPGDVVYVVSESQPAIMRGIVSIMGTTQLKLDAPIPNVYQVNTTDIARLYKQLQ